MDAEGNVYLTGATNSLEFPTEKPLQAENSGSYDAFVAKLSPEGSALVFSTYIGGKGEDRGNGIAVDSRARSYTTGVTVSTDFPIYGPFQSVGGGAFVTRAGLSADLSVTGRELPSSIIPGASFTDQFTVTNNGPSYASGVVLTSAGPAGVTIVSAEPTQGNCVESGGIVECNLGDLPVGTSATVTIQFDVGASVMGTITISAIVTGNEIDPEESSNTATGEALVTAPPTPAPTLTPTMTPTATATLTPVPTPNPTAAPTSMPTHMPSATPTLVPTATLAPTEVSTSTPPPTSAPAATITPRAVVGPTTSTPEAAATLTPVPPSETPTAAFGAASTAGATPTTEPTVTPTPAPTGGGGCTASERGQESIDGGWLLLGLIAPGLALILIHRRRRRD